MKTTNWKDEAVDQQVEIQKDLLNKVCVISDGMNGLELAKSLTEKGATVLLGVDNMRKGKELAEQIEGMCVPIECDLKNLNSVKRFAMEIDRFFPSILILNANREIHSPARTDDRLEAHFGMNYLSHFVLTVCLLKRLTTTNSRIITVAPPITPKGKIEFGEFYQPKNKKQKELYKQSVLMSMFFAKKLDEAFRRSKSPCSSILCYVEKEDKKKKDSSKEILPIVYSATNEQVKSGDEIGYRKKGRQGSIEKLSMIDEFYHARLADNLWKISESLTGVSFSFQ